VVKIEKRLNIFIDESGDFGFSEGSSELFAISFVLHESSNSIKNEMDYLNQKLERLRIYRNDTYSIFNCKKRRLCLLEPRKEKESILVIILFRQKVKNKDIYHYHK